MIYFRCGYSPDQYPSEKEWDARLLMERSKAIKSPSIHYHLAGTKKVQQELSLKGNLERFFDDQAKIDAVRAIFTGLYSVDKVMLQDVSSFSEWSLTITDHNISMKITISRTNYKPKYSTNLKLLCLIKH